MVQYQPTIHTTARKELNALPSDAKDDLVGVIKDVATYESPTSHEKARMLEGQPGLFRVRVGQHRAICTLDKPTLKVVRVGHRKDVYDVVDDLTDRLAPA